MSKPRPVTHFVGFQGEEYWSAVRIWGEPHVIHRGWDRRALREIGPDDVVVFATGTAADEPRVRSFDDYTETWPKRPMRRRGWVR